ncbi:MAG: hypothetical protein KKF67_02675 [Nanoarchaeota archaeon]|nr:hypothetical protein [Nanoarchaeota archaeon]
MAKIMDCKGASDLAKRLLEKVVDENPNILDILDSNYILHLENTSKVAGETYDDSIDNYPRLKKYLVREELVLSGGLHDIGRPYNKDQVFHEPRGARYLEENGLELGVADNIVNVYRIAQMFRSHFVVAEQFADDENAEARAEFEPLDSALLIPRTWQEAIITYADMSNTKGERVPYQERIDGIKKKYAPSSKAAQFNPTLAKAMEKGVERVFEVCNRVQRLRDGKLTEQEIRRYGFL